LSPTDCERVLRQIELYLDGELVARERAEVEEHLGGCSPCMGHAEFQRKLKEMLRDTCGCREIPPDLLGRVRSVFRTTRPPA
jgi:mycothiol system anti-sigma-R factor